MDFKYPHWRLYNAVIEAFFEQPKNGNQPLGYSEIYRKSLPFLNRSIDHSSPDRNYNPSRTTFSHILKKMKHERIVKEGLKSRPNQIELSLTDDAKIMRRLKILGISEESITFTRIYEQILLSIVFPARTNIPPESLDEFLSRFRANRNGLPLGVSIEDFLSSYYLKYDHKIVNDAFGILNPEEEQNKIIKKIFFDDDIRFVLTDENLHHLIEIVGLLFVQEMSMLNCKWRHFSPPTEEESNRLEWLVGKDVARRTIHAAAFHRHENKNKRENKKERCKNLEEYITYLKLGNINELELSLIDSTIGKNIASIGSSNDDIQEYFKELENSFKELETNFINKIKDVQQKYKQTIRKYRYIFQHILNHICPLLLKQFGSVNFESPKSFNSQERFKLMEMVYTAISKS